MKKSILYSLVILLVLLIIGLLSLKNGKIGVTNIDAYDFTWTLCAGVQFGPNLVNGMEPNIPGCTTPLYAPQGSYADIFEWQPYAPALWPLPQRGIINLSDLYNPTTMWGYNMMKVTWTGTDLGSLQKMFLPGAKFENVGSDAADTFNSRTDWTKYGFIRFGLYCNEYGNGFGSSQDLAQTFTLYDGGMSKTVGPVQFTSQWAEPFIYHCTASINFLMNSYDRTNTWNARYFKVSTLAGLYIDAPIAPYDLFTNGQFHVYYDFLTLGARTDVANYGAVSNGKVGTARGVKPVEGAWISWDASLLNPMPTLTPAMPVTGYHVFRSESVTRSGHPYYSIGISVGQNITSVVDTACPGGNTFCYKVLVLNNGPTGYALPPSPGSPSDKTNTINATYHEALLDDVGEICGWVDKVPTPTPTATLPGYIVGTPTVTPYVTPPLIDAHVYPNPFNPNSSVTDKKFYVENVVYDTKVKIYAMDGALVMGGKLNVSDQHYDSSVIPPRFWWDGKNKNGTQVVSGLYYLVLETPKKETSVIRIIVCYKCDPVYKP